MSAIPCHVRTYTAKMLRTAGFFFMFCLGVAENVHQRSGTQQCPPIPVIDSTTTTPYWYRGNDFTIFLKVCTDTTVARFSPSWTRRPWSLSDACSGIVSNYTLSNSTEIRDGGITTCFTMSITIYNATSCPDTGQYTAAVSNQCGSTSKTIFDVYVTDCPCNTSTPNATLPPGETQNFVYALSQDPQNFTFDKLHYVGCKLSVEYSIEISRIGSSSLVCKDPPSPLWDNKGYSCGRDSGHRCSFNVTFTIVNYSLKDSGKYCFQPTSSSWADGARVCPLNFMVVRWPKVTEVNVPVALVKITIIWTIHNFSKDYNHLEFTANGRKIDPMRDGYSMNIENTSDHYISKIHLILPTFFVGEVELKVNFTDEVKGYTTTTFTSQLRSPDIKTQTWLSMTVVCPVILLAVIGAFITACGCGCKRCRKKYSTYDSLRSESLCNGSLRNGSFRSFFINGAESVLPQHPVKAKLHPQSSSHHGHRVQRYSVGRDVKVYRIVSHLQKAIDRSVKPLLLLPYLRSCSVLTQIEYDRIIHPGTVQHDQISLIVDAVVSKGQKALDEFIKALTKETEHPSHRELAKMFHEALNGSLTPVPDNYSLVDDVITPHLPDLMNYLNSLALLQHLQKYQLVTSEEVERLINSTLTSAGCNRLIFSQLYRCGADAVENFIRCLIEEETHPSHHKLAKLLIQQLSELEQYQELARRLDLALSEVEARTQLC